MSRRPGYETLDYVGLDYESRRETMAGRQAADIGRYGQRGPDAATRRAWAELAQISDIEHRRMILRTLELSAP